MQSSDAPAPSDTPGWYGKLAALGDFAERRLPQVFVARADAWLSLAMSASRAQLGAAWLEHYLNAPLLRFAWAPGVVDAAWWFGVMMPSCDNVGRYFPLLIGSRRLDPPQTGTALDHLEAWFDHLASAATGTLADGATIESFEAALGAAPRWRDADAPLSGSQQLETPNGSGAADSQSSGGGVRRWLHGMASTTLQARLGGCSIWWHAEAGGGMAATSVVSGLPDPAWFGAMLAAG